MIHLGKQKSYISCEYFLSASAFKYSQKVYIIRSFPKQAQKSAKRHTAVVNRITSFPIIPIEDKILNRSDRLFRFLC